MVIGSLMQILLSEDTYLDALHVGNYELAKEHRRWSTFLKKDSFPRQHLLTVELIFLASPQLKMVVKNLNVTASYSRVWLAELCTLRPQELWKQIPS